MRLTILLLNDHIIAEQKMDSALLDEECHATFSRLSDIKQLDELLSQEPIDLFIIKASDDHILAYAQELLTVTTLRPFPTIYIMNKEDAQTLARLKDMGAKYVLYGEPSYHELASFVTLVVQKERYKRQLSVMGGYIKESTIVCEKDKDGDFVFKYVNKACLELEKLTKNDLLEKKIKNSHLLFGMEHLIEDMEEVYQTSTPVHMPNYFYLKEGLREWCDVYIYKSNSEQVSVISSNLSEIKRAHDKATQSNRYLQTILNAQHHIIYITDGEKLINTNNAFLDFFQSKTMFDFIKSHKRVCNVFEEATESFYIGANEPGWHKKVALNPQEQYKIRIKQADIVHCFIPSIQTIMVDDKEQYVVILTNITELESEKEKLRLLAMTDPLTGAHNRLKFNTVIDQFIDLSLRNETPLSIVMLDIDNFKKINDNFSHHTGDEVLKEFVSTVCEHVRKSDLFVRWGGEEFLLVLANADNKNACNVAEKFRKIIETSSFSEIGRITCSVGVTSLAEKDTISSLVARADEALYQAKAMGRNRVMNLLKS